MKIKRFTVNNDNPSGPITPTTTSSIPPPVRPPRKNSPSMSAKHGTIQAQRDNIKLNVRSRDVTTDNGKEGNNKVGNYIFYFFSTQHKTFVVLFKGYKYFFRVL